MIILDGWGVHLCLCLPVIAAGSAASLGGFRGGAAGEGEDLQRALGGGGRVGGASLIATDMVYMVPKQTAITLQSDTSNSEERIKHSRM